MYPHARGALQWRLHLEYLDGHRQTVRSKREYEAWRAANPDWVSSVLEARSEFPNHAGTAVWIRPDLARAALAETMRATHGWRTLAEVDDNYLSPARQNLALRTAKWNDAMRAEHLTALCSMDGIVFSTDLLRDMYWRKIRKFYRRDPVRKGAPWLDLHVCRNNVPEDVWPTRVERDGPVRVGWMGSPSHVWDVNRAWLALRHAKGLGAETWMIGYNPVDDNQSTGIVIDGEPLPPSPRSQFNMDQWAKVGFKHIPWRTPDKFERFALPLDIGLCPLKTNQNTLGKSDVKFLEYAISGAATIAQNNKVYNRTIIHGETGLLVNSEQDMARAVELLIRDENLRARLVANAQQYVRECRGEKQLREEWLAAVAG